HPFDPDYGPFWEDWVGFYEYWAELRGYLLLCPFARGNQDFRGIGEADLWQAYEETQRLYNIDPDRVYVTGVSMGGTGTWHVALRHPDRFAGLAAVAGRGGNIRQLGPNVGAVPAYVVHGGADDVVPSQHSQAMAGAVRGAGGRMFLSWHPLVRHSVFPEETRNVFDWFARCTRPAAPRQIRYRTETLKYDRAYWVRVDALGEGRRTPEIQATLGEDNAISVSTVNIDAYTLTPPPELVAPGAHLTVRTNGRLSYEGPLPDEGLSLRRVPGSRDEFGRLLDGAGADAGLRKRHGLQGPISEAFTSPFLYVYGTGQDDPALAAASEAAARAARDRMEKTAHGSFPMKADADVTPEDIAHYNLILYGTAGVNGIMAQIADDLPMRLDNGRLALRGETLAAPSVGVKMIYPNPLAAGKYVVVNLGTDADVLQALAELRVYFVDYVVIGRRHRQESYQCLRDGHFDQRWQLATVPGGDVRVVTDTSWRCHENPPPGWTAPGFDDRRWPRAAAHTKGLWPDINFATHFDDRAAAIWYPEPDPVNVTRYFRRTFELPGPVEWARATVLVEDECELYVNGLRVRRIGYEEGVVTVSLRRHLQPGTNVLAVKAYEAFGDQGVVMDCVVTLREEHSPA
ncbi:MAG: prolyl oligopeptidase family serine peptidase, partial [Armatimonadota bacterium]